MDPTYNLARIHYSFANNNDYKLYIPWFSYTESETVSKPNKLRDIETEIQHRFEYQNHDFLLMANLDILNYTMSNGGYLAQQTGDIITYVFLKPRPGQIEYLQWRRPACYGYVLINNGDELNQDNITKHYGNNEQFTTYVRSIEIDGVDIALSNDNTVNALVTCCDCLKHGGTCIINYNNPQILFNMSRMFERILLFRPMCDVNKLFCVGMGYNQTKYKDHTMTNSFINWFNNLHNPQVKIDTYLAKAIWNL